MREHDQPGTVSEPTPPPRTREPDRRHTVEVGPDGLPGRVREEDLEPHSGLRYIARLFKFLSVLLILLMVAEVIVGFMQEGRQAAVFLMVEATRMLVFAGLLWGVGDIATLLIESNHDLRAVRVLLTRVVGKMDEE